MKRAMKIAVSLTIPVILLSLVSLHLMCRDGEGTPPDARSDNAIQAAATVATTLPAGPNSVRVCIMMVIHKEYGVLARVMGKQNATMTNEPYAAGKAW